MSAVFANLLRVRLSGLVELSAGQIAALEAHHSLLLRWNNTLNLTTITSLEEIVERHYCEALFLGAHLPAGSLRIADIGSGAGFPGFPVAILRPDCKVTLVESHQRKAVFLKEASRGIGNVEVVAKRAEQLSDQYDHVISRAVSYQDLKKVLKVLAPVADLLSGAEDPPGMGFDWKQGIALPWGQARYLRIGKRLT